MHIDSQHTGPSGPPDDGPGSTPQSSRETRPAAPASALAAWGYTRADAEAFASFAEDSFEPARVLEEHRDRFVVTTGDLVLSAQVPGIRSGRADATPAVGDFVAIERAASGADDPAVVRAVLPRRSAFARRAVGRERRVAHRGVDVEIVCANLDHVLVLTSLNADFSPRRVERFLAQIWEGGAQPVVVLTKSDLSDGAEERRSAAAAVAPGVPVHVISALHRTGLDTLVPYFAPGVTSALVGSSGVGKSTLVNALLGFDAQTVRAIREHDATGVHTTTSRRLVRVPGGGCLVDTPGLRELGLVDAESGVDAAFVDVTSLAPQCRFRDCVHAAEPGCAVQQAIDRGELAPERLESWQLLRRELAFTASKERRRDRKATKAGRTPTREGGRGGRFTGDDA